MHQISISHAQTKVGAPRSGFDEALQEVLSKVVQRSDASAMKAWRAHAAIATQHSRLDLEIAGGCVKIQKQDGAICVSATAKWSYKLNFNSLSAVFAVVLISAGSSRSFFSRSSILSLMPCSSAMRRGEPF